MSLRLDGAVALVTGAASGLGQAEAVKLAELGAFVVCADRHHPQETLERIASSGGRAEGLIADLAEPEQADTVVDRAVASGGGLDILVNNAGVVRDGMSFRLFDEDWDAVSAVNLTATFRLCRAASRWWRNERVAGRSRPRSIVNTSSESGLYGNVGQVNYAAAKAGVAALTVTLAGELARDGVQVNAIAPRALTPMSAAAFDGLAGSAAGRLLAPSHVADVVGWLVSADAGDITGQVLVVYGSTVEVMKGWSVDRSNSARIPRDEDALCAQMRALFSEPHLRRYLPDPVGDLFVETAMPASRRSS